MLPAGEEGVSKLISLARQEGEATPLWADRRWIRYTIGMPLEVTTSPDDGPAPMEVTTHNVSGGGVGFWSTDDIAEGTAVWVREKVEASSAPWLAAKVVHSMSGLHGYLVGVAFEDPAPPDSRKHAADRSKAGPPTAGPASDGEKSFKPRAQGCPLGLKVGCLSAFTAGVGGAAALIISQVIWPDSSSLVGPCVLAFSAIGVCALLGWAAVAGEARFLRRLADAMRCISEGKFAPMPRLVGLCRELDALARAVSAMSHTWQRRPGAPRLSRQKIEELDRVKNNIVTVVAHDLRTPLTSIQLYAQTLSAELDKLGDEDRRRFLGIISEESTRLSRLIDDLLDVQRLVSSPAEWDLKPQDLAETIVGCAAAFEAPARGQSIRLYINCPRSLPAVEADADKIAQVLTHLLSNALKFTLAGGSVWLSAQADSREVLIRVADTGPGIPREKWDDVFDPFARVSDDGDGQEIGAGLGLAIVRQIVERHGGRVWIDSVVDRGSEFFVALPVYAAHAQGEPRFDVFSASGRVVVCDAAPELAAQIAQTLRAQHYEVRLAHSGCRLLALVAEGNVDVVVTDVLLPDMSAAELLDGLAAIQPRTFRLVVHTYAGNGMELRRRGADVYLQRPASKEALIQAVQVASRKLPAASKAVMLVEDGGFRVPRLAEVLSGRGYLPIATPTLAAATEQMYRYLVDAVVLSEKSLGAEWSELRELHAAGEQSARVVVICRQMNRSVRRLADGQGVAVVEGRPGREKDIAAKVIAALEGRPAETLS